MFPVTVPGAAYYRHVTVPGSHSGCSAPIIAFLPGGIENLTHRLAEEIREQLRKLGLQEGAANPTRGDGKRWDVT